MSHGELMGDMEEAAERRIQVVEAEAAVLRQALETIDRWWTVPHAQEAGVGDAATITTQEHSLRRAVEAARKIAAEALKGATAGQSILDELQQLRERNRLLSIVADGCPTHPGYRAKRQATATYCDCCAQVWEAKQALSRMDQEASTNGR